MAKVTNQVWFAQINFIQHLASSPLSLEVVHLLSLFLAVMMEWRGGGGLGSDDNERKRAEPILQCLESLPYVHTWYAGPFHIPALSIPQDRWLRYSLWL